MKLFEFQFSIDITRFAQKNLLKKSVKKIQIRKIVNSKKAGNQSLFLCTIFEHFFVFPVL